MRPCLRERILKRRTIYKSNSSETSEFLKQAQFYIALIAKYVTWRWIVTPWQRHHWHSFPPSHKFEPSLDNDDSTSKNSTEHHSLEKGCLRRQGFFRKCSSSDASTPLFPSLDPEVLNPCANSAQRVETCSRLASKAFTHVQCKREGQKTTNYTSIVSGRCAKYFQACSIEGLGSELLKKTEGSAYREWNIQPNFWNFLMSSSHTVWKRIKSRGKFNLSLLRLGTLR